MKRAVIGAMAGDFTMTNDIEAGPEAEPMIDSKQAAVALQLPYYWFADHAMRKKHRIPHYLMGGLVRYRLGELARWAAQSTSSRHWDAADVDQPGQGAE